MPKTKHLKVKPAGAASENLANSSHCDVFDFSRGWAGWVKRDPRAPDPERWALLFPDVGLVIHLCDGVCVSWDGRVHRHCTSVQRSGTSLLSFFVGMQDGVAVVCRALEEFGMAQRAAKSGAGLTALPLSDGDSVWVRWGDARSGWRRRSGVVTATDEAGIRICFSKEEIVTYSWGEVEGLDS